MKRKGKKEEDNGRHVINRRRRRIPEQHKSEFGSVTFLARGYRFAFSIVRINTRCHCYLSSGSFSSTPCPVSSRLEGAMSPGRSPKKYHGIERNAKLSAGETLSSDDHSGQISRNTSVSRNPRFIAGAYLSNRDGGASEEKDLAGGGSSDREIRSLRVRADVSAYYSARRTHCKFTDRPRMRARREES